MIQDRLLVNQKYIVDSIKNGISTAQLGKEFDCNGGTIWYFLKSIGVSLSKKRSKNYGKQDQFKDDIIKLFDEGYSAYKIAQKLKVSKPFVLRWLKHWGYNTSIKSKVNSKNLLKDKQEQVLALYKAGYGTRKIANIVGHSDSAIWRLLNNLNVIEDRTYKVNEDYFKLIDTADKAYVLGWLYSDGNIVEAERFRISIVSEDDYVLKWIKNEIRYEGPLYYRPSRPNSPKPQTELCVNRKVMAEDLLKLGCMPAKSMILEFPTDKQVSYKFLPDFIRGYLEGDGSAKAGITITSTLSFCLTLQQFLPLDITNIYQRYKNRNPEDSSHQLFIGRKAEMLKFYNYIYYTPDLPCLLRKKEDLEKQIF